MAKATDEREWKRVAAFYTDTFDVAVIPDVKMARMAFSESMGRGKEPAVRTAIMMPFSDAKELVRILAALIAEAEGKATNAKPDPDPSS